jgi:hypothetical protein
MLTQAVTILTRVPEVASSNPSRTPTVLTENFIAFVSPHINLCPVGELSSRSSSCIVVSQYIKDTGVRRALSGSGVWRV